MSADFEARSLQLVADTQLQLAATLNSLTGKQHQGLQDVFPIYSAGHVNRAADGYVLLRKAGRIDSSKLLIRPALEATIKILAVRKQPELLYRIAYSERLEDQKWIGAAARRQGGDYTAQDEKNWEEFTKAYSTHFPGQRLTEQKLSLRDAAVIAGLGDYYDSHYRLYCQFTHAAFRAVTRGLDELDTHDNRTMAICTLVGIEATVSVGASAPHLGALRNRLEEIDQLPDS
jgi:hypothetical protein